MEISIDDLSKKDYEFSKTNESEDDYTQDVKPSSNFYIN